MERDELREWLGLTWADALVYVGAAAVVGMYFVRSPTWDWVLAVVAIATTVVACPIGIRSKAGFSDLTNRIKRYSYPLMIVAAFFFVWVNFTRWPQ